VAGETAAALTGNDNTGAPVAVEQPAATVRATNPPVMGRCACVAHRLRGDAVTGGSKNPDPRLSPAPSLNTGQKIPILGYAQ